MVAGAVLSAEGIVGVGVDVTTGAGFETTGLVPPMEDPDDHPPTLPPPPPLPPPVQGVVVNERSDPTLVPATFVANART